MKGRVNEPAGSQVNLQGVLGLGGRYHSGDGGQGVEGGWGGKRFLAPNILNNPSPRVVKKQCDLNVKVFAQQRKL